MIGSYASLASFAIAATRLLETGIAEPAPAAR